MKDIYEISWIMLPNPISFLDLWFFLLIILFLFFVYKFVNRDKKYIQKNEKIEIKKQDEKIDYLAKIWSISEKDFFKDISSIFRLFLEKEKKYKNFSKLTLKEVVKEKNIEEKYKLFLENIYFKEYSWEDLGEKDREEVLGKLKSFIK